MLQWREECGLKKKKVKHEKKRFIDPGHFEHEKWLKSFLEFIGKGKKKGKDLKELWKQYEENKQRIKDEFLSKKKIDMYWEQAEWEV